MPNHLSSESSPYLQQHANNPVDWYPWGGQAFALAREQDKPILLSIGYSTCHWCHVMARESFEDEATATLMNRDFICIKVDREERPDLDQIYQNAHYLLAGRHGGWPLNLFLTPDQTPFFGGTYFPPQARYNLPSFKDLLQRVAQAYQERRQDIDLQNISLLKSLTATPAPTDNVELGQKPLADALIQLGQSFDPEHGGFGGAPKFPRPGEIAFCLRRYAADGNELARDMALHTLQKIADGGIHDQLGGGFCRYSVDERWLIPHFEKMLYDNGPLLGLYAEAWRCSGDESFRRVAEENVAWLAREMRAPAGGFYSALDADSEHEEGKFYVWTPQQVAAALAADEYAVLSRHYGLDQPANFEERHWHFHVAQPLERVVQSLGMELADAHRLLDSARAKLMALRDLRIRPGRDEKILTSWNALAIKGLAQAGSAFERDDWIALAQQAADFIRAELWRNGRLLASWKDGKAYLDAYLDDYAFLLDALIALMQARFRNADLDFARDLAEALLAQFEDRGQGGFFFTASDHETLIYRPKSGPDNATPSGNAVAAFALQRLGHLLGETRYLTSAERALKLFYPHLAAQPAGFMTFLCVLEEYLEPPQIVILRGPEQQAMSWQQELARTFRPATMVLTLPNGLEKLPGCLGKPTTPTVNAWVCQGVSCLPAIDDIETLRRVCSAGNKA
ncbi:MAG: thioredoxin domain-containing protein [Betaproteobacteria bacterium]|nr:thioredoxin domain-containing protein [Betaproteobacteria bacterium]